MKVTITAGSVSAGDGTKHRTGEVVDVDDSTAKSWVAVGAARPVTTEDENRESARVQEHKAPDASKRPTTKRTAVRGEQKASGEDEQ